MAVFRVEKNSGYTVMSNHHLRNRALSLKAKGLLSQMLSLPEDWDYTLQGLARINRESIDAIRQAIRELEQAGYIQRSRERDEKGRLRGADYVIFELPKPVPASVSPTLENPTLENPTQENPTLENPMQLNNPQGLFISGYFAEEEKRFAIPYNIVLASNVDELNFLASRLETLSTGERAELNAALQAPQSELFSIGRITDFPENVDYYVHLPDVRGPAQLGDYYLNRSGMVDMPEEWKGGIDTAQFGRYVAQQEQGVFTEYGYLVKSGDAWQKVHEGQPVPEEYRVLSFPAPEVLRDSANIPPPVQPETEPQKVIPIMQQKRPTNFPRLSKFQTPPQSPRLRFCGVKATSCRTAKSCRCPWRIVFLKNWTPPSTRTGKRTATRAAGTTRPHSVLILP